MNAETAGVVTAASPIQSATTGQFGAGPNSHARTPHGDASDDQDQQNAPRTWKHRATSVRDAAKAAAMDKLDSLKAELRALMLTGGDPEQREAAAADIAGQIAAAARAYAQAGGDPGAAATASAGPATGATAAGTDPLTGSDGSTATPGSSSGPSQMDAAFMQEARDLAHQAQAIILAAAQTLLSQHKQPDPRAAQAGDDAVAAVEMAALEVGESPLGGYDPDIHLHAPPAISLLA